MTDQSVTIKELLDKLESLKQENNLLKAQKDITFPIQTGDSDYINIAKLEAALSSMTDALFISDDKGQFIHFHDAFATFHRFKKKSDCAKWLHEYPDIIDVFMDTGEPAPLEMWAVPRALRGETVTDAEYKLRRKDTGEIWIGSYNFSPIMDKYGKIVGSVVIGRDITEQKRSEMELRESEARYQVEKALKESAIIWQSVFDGIKDSIILLDNNGIILQANKTALNIFGKKVEKILGEHVHDVVDKSVYPFDNCPFVRSGLSKKREKVTLQKENRWFDVSAEPVLGESNSVIIIIYIITEITERKKNEIEIEKHRNNLEELVKLKTEDLNKTNEELRQKIGNENRLSHKLKLSLEKEKELNQMRLDFLTTTSHEFRTPLTIMLTATELLQRYGVKWSNKKKNEHYLRIQRAVDYLVKLVEDSRTLSALVYEKDSFNPKMMNFKKVADKCYDAAVFRSNKNHKIVYEFNLTDRELFFDPDLLKYILNNLLSNAIKYSPDGGKIELNIRLEKNEIIIKVRDEGIGIPSDDVNKVFEPYFRTKLTENISGIGLGLAIAKRAVALHGGEITLTSKPGRGSEFLVSVPLKDALN